MVARACEILSPTPAMSFAGFDRSRFLCRNTSELADCALRVAFSRACSHIRALRASLAALCGTAKLLPDGLLDVANDACSDKLLWLGVQRLFF